MKVLTPVRSIIAIQLIPILVAVSAIGLSLGMGSSTNEQSPIMLFVLLIYCIFASVWLAQLLSSKLVISDTGLEAINGQEHRVFLWEELTKITQTDAGRVFADFSESASDLPLHKKWVDLTPYLDMWAGSPIQVQIQTSAPHVKLPRKLRNRIIAPYWQCAWPIFVYLLIMLPVGLLAGLSITNSFRVRLLSELLTGPGMTTWFLAHLGTAAGLMPYHSWLAENDDQVQIQTRALSLYILPVTSTLVCIVFFTGWLWVFGEDMTGKLQAINRSNRGVLMLASGISILLTALLQDKIIMSLLTKRK